MREVWAIASKDMRLLLRDRMGFFFAFFFPLIIAVFFGMIFSGGGKNPRIGVAVVDLDDSSSSRALVLQLQSDSQLAVEPLSEREMALRRVRSGKTTAAIIVPEGFGSEQEGMFFSSGAEVELAVDPSRNAERGMLEGLLLKHGFLSLQAAFRDTETAKNRLRVSRERLIKDNSIGPLRRLAIAKLLGDLERFVEAVPDEVVSPVTPSQTIGPANPVERSGQKSPQQADASSLPAPSPEAWSPMQIRMVDVTERSALGDAQVHPPEPPSSFAVTFPQGIIWGVMGCALGFSISMVSERTRGTLIRLRVAPIAPWQILLGKALACFLTTLAVASFLVIIGTIAFGVRPTSWAILGVAIVCTGVCFVGVMMLLAVLSPSERSSSGLGWGVLLLLSMIGGGMLPLVFMPEWMRALSVVSPIRWAILAIEGGIWRDSDWSDLVLPCGILLGVGICGVLAGSRLLKRQTGND